MTSNNSSDEDIDLIEKENDSKPMIFVVLGQETMKEEKKQETETASRE